MKQAIYVLMVMLIVGVASAGTIADDCTRTDNRCVETKRVCTNWHHCHCTHWSNVCVQYEEYCTDSITTETDIDADTVQGVDVVQVIEDNDAKWSQDNVGGGTSMSSVQRYLMGDFMDFLRGLFVTRVEFNALEDKMYEQEVRLYFLENDIAYDATDLMVRAAFLEMQDKGVWEVQHGEYQCSYAHEQMTCLRVI